jgi:hypothetical protein
MVKNEAAKTASAGKIIFNISMNPSMICVCLPLISPFLIDFYTILFTFFG